MSKLYLRRYSDLTALIYLLSSRRLTLLDPNTWDDQNDSYYLAPYKKKKKLKSILALCFTETDERYHFWKVFGSGHGGVCIQFRRAPLLKAINKQSDVRTGLIEYVRIPELREKQLRSDDLPFLKRFAFKHESEFRLIYESKTRTISTLDVEIPLSCIDKITLNPWVHPTVFKCVKGRLRSIAACGSTRIVRSTLINNEEWKRLGERAT